jgi:2-methylisocitrate lyase-like PEP mutase family enzyme
VGKPGRAGVVQDDIVSAADRRARFRELHQEDRLFLMPNPWDVGSARFLERLGVPALATTSAGFAWSLGKPDQQVTRDELVDHVAAVAAAVSVPLNVDSERLYPDEPGGVAETVRMLAEAGASGCSIEDYNPASGAIDGIAEAAARVSEAAEAAHQAGIVLTGRCEHHIRGVDDLDGTIERLIAYRDAGADCLYAPGLIDLDEIRRVVDEVAAPVNVLALPAAPPIGDLEAAGVRRVSTGSLLAGTAYGALVAAAQELFDEGTSRYAAGHIDRSLLAEAFGPD